MPHQWIDISVTLKDGMVHWPGDPPAVITRTLDVGRGDPATVSRLSIGSHTGTHMDAPLHFLKGGRGLDRMPLSVVLGPARVIAIRHPRVVEGAALRRMRLRPGERILLKTRNSSRCWKTDDFVEDFVHLSQDAAHELARAKVSLVGIDYLSVGGFKQDGDLVHRILLTSGVWILEGLNLSRATPGMYELACLPLKILHSDGAPARAVIRPLSIVGGG